MSLTRFLNWLISLFFKNPEPKINPHPVIPEKPILYTPRNEKEKALILGLAVLQGEGFNPWCIFTQAWHETGAFKHVIGTANYWGIKASSHWTGLTHDVKTWEVIDGKRVDVVAKFADWVNVESALLWYAGLVKRLYPQAYAKRDNPIMYFAGLVSGPYKWATDPVYVDKLERVYRELSTFTGLDQALKSCRV